MIKILVYDTKIYDKDAFSQYENDKDLSFTYVETKLNIDTVSLSKGYDVVCVFVNDDVNKDVIDELYKNNVKLIALRSAGYNNVDVKNAFGKIHVVHVPSYSPYAIAEHAMALLLTSIRRIHKAYNRTRDFNFSLSGLTGFDLHGKTIGVIGTGKIGRIFIDICKGFGMNILAYDLYPIKDSDIHYVTLDELFNNSDIISLHCPLTDSTKHLINKNSIDKMKKGVIIVNTSRGGLIKAEDLIEGIRKRKIGGACLDVYKEESDIFFTDHSGHILDDELLSRLISLPNVIVTSHQAFLTTEALDNIASTTVNNIKTFFKDNRCENELCYRCGKIELCKMSRKRKCF